MCVINPRADTVRFWLALIHAGKVVGLLGGPPCETWCVLRGHGPGPGRVRSIAELWGIAGLDGREARQVLLGNQLPDGSVPDCIASLHQSHSTIKIPTLGAAIQEEWAPPPRRGVPKRSPKGIQKVYQKRPPRQAPRRHPTNLA